MFLLMHNIMALYRPALYTTILYSAGDLNVCLYFPIFWFVHYWAQFVKFASLTTCIVGGGYPMVQVLLVWQHCECQGGHCHSLPPTTPQSCNRPFAVHIYTSEYFAVVVYMQWTRGQLFWIVNNMSGMGEEL